MIYSYPCPYHNSDNNNNTNTTNDTTNDNTNDDNNNENNDKSYGGLGPRGFCIACSYCNEWAQYEVCRSLFWQGRGYEYHSPVLVTGSIGSGVG